MSLQGTLETFALPDVLVLLSSTKKTGELRVAGARGEGRVWVEKGQIVHSQTNGKGAEPVDTVFELLRLDTGTFAFDNDAAAPKKDEPQAVDLVLADAQGRLTEWQEIERVVPHLDAVVDMAPAAPADEVTVTSAQWKLLVGVAGGRAVHTLMDRLDRSEFDTCRTVKELVDAGLATIDTAAKATKPAPAKPETKTEAAEAKTEAKPEPADEKPVPAAKTDDKADESEKSGSDEDNAADELVEELGRARRIRTSASSQGGERAPLANVGANGNGKGKPETSEPNRDDDTEALVAQLAALGVDEDDPEAKEKIAARLAEESAASEGDEPINRGLLLKFLSSVRN